MQHNLCKTCGATNGRCGMCINDECLNCHDTRKTGACSVHADLERTDEELAITFAIIKD